jgi:hypothetical protein
MNGRKPTIGFWATSAAVCAVVVIAVYGVAYWLLVMPERGHTGVFWPGYGSYGKFGPTRTESFLCKLFEPAHWIDRDYLRPSMWDNGLCGRVQFVNDDEPNPAAPPESD